MKKAFDMWGWEQGAVQLDPETAGWPSLSFYVHLLAQKIHYGIGALRGAFDDPYDFYVAYQLDPSSTVLLARSIGVAASLVVVWIGTRIALRLGGVLAGFLVGALLVTSPLLVEHAQLVTPDVLLTMFAALAVAAILRIHEQGRARDYVWAGVWVGLGAASKYTPVLLTISIYVVHLMRLRHEGRSLRRLGLDDRRLGWATLASVLSFCLASPYTLASLEVLRRDFAYQALHMRQGHFGHTDQGLGLLYYVIEVLPRGLGWPGLVLCVAGLGAAAWMRRGIWLAVLACVAPLYLLLGSLSTQFDRYMLPVILPLALGAAGAVVAGRDLLRPRPVWLRRGAVAAAALVCVVPTGLRLWRYHSVQGNPSTQKIAERWITENIPSEGTTLAMELYAPHLPPDLRGETMSDPVFARLSEDQRTALLERPYYNYQFIPLYSTRVELAAYYYDLRHYYPYDYIVTSGAVRRRYESDPNRFPEQVAFYQDLDRLATLVRTFRPDETTRGPEIRLYQLTQRDKQEIRAEKGILQPQEYREWASRLHAPHFLRFVESVAIHALLEEEYELAAFYFQMLYETSPEEDRPAVTSRLAEALLQAGRFEEAQRRYEELLRVDPGHVFALGNLGYLHERRGEVEQARELYRRCIELDPAGRAGAWSRQRLEAMERAVREEPPTHGSEESGG